MASIVLKHIAKVYPGDIHVVKDFNLEIKDKEFVVFVGPSGCGKSTTLRMIAGLEDISGGELYIGDRLVNDVAPKDRNIAMVFQNYALYPHMTVYKNMAYGLMQRKMPKDEIDRRIKNAAEILGITQYLERKPKALSGGQRQRVALGRAMVRDPDVFLLDEPLSNLDAKLRTTMRSEIAKLHKRLGTTFIYVTHDQIEAMTMGDRIVVMKDGDIMQVDTPQMLYEHPNSKFVAGFIGSPQMNFMEVTVERDAESPSGFACVLDNKHHFAILPREGMQDFDAYEDKKVIMGIRPEHIYTGRTIPGETDMADLPAMIDLVEPVGSEVYLFVEVAGFKLCAKLPPITGLEEGEQVNLKIDLKKMYIFDAETEKALYN